MSRYLILLPAPEADADLRAICERFASRAEHIELRRCETGAP